MIPVRLRVFQFQGDISLTGFDTVRTLHTGAEATISTAETFNSEEKKTTYSGGYTTEDLQVKFSLQRPR